MRKYGKMLEIFAKAQQLLGDIQLKVLHRGERVPPPQLRRPWPLASYRHLPRLDITCSRAVELFVHMLTFSYL